MLLEQDVISSRATRRIFVVELKSGRKPLALPAVADNGKAAQAQEGMGSWGSPGWLQAEGLPGEWEGLPWAPPTPCLQASTLWGPHAA